MTIEISAAMEGVMPIYRINGTVIGQLMQMDVVADCEEDAIALYIQGAEIITWEDSSVDITDIVEQVGSHDD